MNNNPRLKHSISPTAKAEIAEIAVMAMERHKSIVAHVVEHVEHLHSQGVSEDDALNSAEGFAQSNYPYECCPDQVAVIALNAVYDTYDPEAEVSA